LLTITGVSFGSSDEDDESEEVEPVLNLREILQVKPLNIPVLEGEVSIDGVLDEPFWKEATYYEIKLETVLKALHYSGETYRQRNRYSVQIY
jgi:hypothetical protein